ncbi:MAG: phosphoribosylaminoimidazole carboxylase, ATPase subunit [Chitinophagaceae bacterium]|nr:phosphoribosylaminoimidazole carboxylase, ATPase subunit [Chitinophagaceae bacterium]
MKKGINQSVGILGGGQLGRMLIQSAIDFNLDLSVMDPDPDAPCKNFTSKFTNASLQDEAAILEWAKDLDLITIEIEHVNIEALKKLQQAGKKIYPQPQVLEIIQDKRKQKEFYRSKGLPTAPFVLLNNKEEIANHAHLLPAFQKLGKNGYDGKGVQRIATIQDIAKGFDDESLLEQAIPFEKELAVIVARNEQGEVKTFPVVEMVFNPVHNLVEYLFSPADIAPAIAAKADALAKEVIVAFDMVGLLAVELFLTKEGEVLINEVAPRPHNSGHQSIEANDTSQYEQHLRAILGLPLGSTRTLSPSAMVNILGEDGFSGEVVYEGLEKALTLEGVHVHFYGKKTTKPFRKMGHVTILDENLEALKEKAKAVKSWLKIKA